MYPLPIQQLINAFSKLPSVGARTAERYVFYLLKSGKKDVAELTNALKLLIERIKSCETCWDFSDQSPCRICRDPERDRGIICVVDQPQIVQVIEKTGAMGGTFHVLRGTIRSDDPETIASLKIPELLKRIEASHIEEIILALNPDLDGENTMMYLEQKIKESAPGLAVSRLVRGLPMGSDLLYADEVTLGSALKHRTSAST